MQKSEFGFGRLSGHSPDWKPEVPMGDEPNRRRLESGLGISCSWKNDLGKSCMTWGKFFIYPTCRFWNNLLSLFKIIWATFCLFSKVKNQAFRGLEKIVRHGCLIKVPRIWKILVEIIISGCNNDFDVPTILVAKTFYTFFIHKERKWQLHKILLFLSITL